MFPIVSTWANVQKDIIDRYVLRRNGGKSKDDIESISRKHLFAEINSQLQNDLYQNQSQSSIINTIKYVFWETRAGIFVSIRNNKLEAFIPFANARYRNDWSSGLTFDGVNPDSTNPVSDYFAYKKSVLGYARYGRLMKDPSKWWANHHFLNIESRADVWGQHSLTDYHDMISSTLSRYDDIPNIMFVINKRDHPILRKDLRKPYTFLYKNNPPMIAHPSRFYAPVLTSYSGSDYLDIVIPIVQDWSMATAPENYYPITTDIPWAEKDNIAFFRGAATGRLIANQRIHLAKLSNDWKLNDSTRDLLDAGITSWNLSDKIDSDGFVHFLNPSKMESIGVHIHKKISMDEQVRYKYIINVDGHTAPNRTGWILASGCLMLKVESLHPNITWIDKCLKAWKHYVPIKADLSDLEEKIRWCHDHDDECYEIMRNGKKFAKAYISQDTICEYMAYLFKRIAANKAIPTKRK